MKPDATTERRRRGRPRMNPTDARTSILSVRLTPQERDLIRDAAERAGASADSDWARDVLVAAATGRE